jgi:predicted phosphodiesterase
VSRKPRVADLVAEQRRGSKGAEQDAKLIESLTAEVTRLRKMRAPKPIKARKGKAAKHIVRAVIPDSHGSHIDQAARDAFLADLRQVQPDEVVWLGDHLDCGGTFSTHQRSYTHELTESYEADVAAANEFIDAVQAIAPNARHHYIFGNHESHIERWAARTFTSHRDAEMVLRLIGPEGVLRLREREFRVVRSSDFVDGLAIPGTIRLGRCFYTHGISHSKHAAAVHLERFNGSVAFGHIHRAMSLIGRTVTSHGHGAFCPGTLAKLQPSYMHTAPTSWSHGWAAQLVSLSTETFMNLHIPIIDGVSMFREVAALGSRSV